MWRKTCMLKPAEMVRPKDLHVFVNISLTRKTVGDLCVNLN